MRGAVFRMSVLCKVEHLCFVLKFGSNNPALHVSPNRDLQLSYSLTLPRKRIKLPLNLFNLSSIFNRQFSNILSYF